MHTKVSVYYNRHSMSLLISSMSESTFDIRSKYLKPLMYIYGTLHIGVSELFNMQQWLQFWAAINVKTVLGSTILHQAKGDLVGKHYINVLSQKFTVSQRLVSTYP